MFSFRKLRCSFCRKDETQVAKLVAGPHVYICDECVAIANRIIEDSSHGNEQPIRVKPSIWRRLVDRLRTGGLRVSSIEA